MRHTGWLADAWLLLRLAMQSTQRTLPMQSAERTLPAEHRPMPRLILALILYGVLAQHKIQKHA